MGIKTSPLKWIERCNGRINWLNYTLQTDYYMGSMLELLPPKEERKGIMYWDPRALPYRYGKLRESQLRWLKRHYILILTEFWNGLISEVRKFIPDVSCFDILMTKDIIDEIEYHKAGLRNCIPYSYSDLTHDLDESILDTPKEFDFVIISNPRAFKRVYETLSELPNGSSVLLLNWDLKTSTHHEFGPYIQACMNVCKQKKHRYEALALPRSTDIYHYYARGRVALQLSSGEGNYRSLTEVVKCGVPTLYTPYIRGGGSRYHHPLRGIGGVGEPVYNAGEIGPKAIQVLDRYGDYKPRRILELTSRKKTLSLMRDNIHKAYEKVGQEWDGEFEELTGWDPGRPWSFLDVRSIPDE